MHPQQQHHQGRRIHPNQNVNVGNESTSSLQQQQQPQRQSAMQTFHEKSKISKTCSPWLIHGMFLLCQYEGWESVCHDIFEDYTRMGLSTSIRKIGSEAIRILEPRHWASSVDVFLNPLSEKDLCCITEKDPAIQAFMQQTILPNLNPDELSLKLHKTPEIMRTAVKLYLAIYLPAEIKDYVNVSIPANIPTCLKTTRKICFSSLGYLDSPEAPNKPPIQTLSLLMQRMMHGIGVLPSVYNERRYKKKE